MSGVISRSHIEAIANYQEQLSASQLGVLAMPDFLIASRAERLRKEATNRTDFRYSLALIPGVSDTSRGRKVSLKEWYEASQDERYFRFEQTEPCRMSASGIISGRPAPFTVDEAVEVLSFVRAVSQCPLQEVSVEFHRMSDNCFIGAHHDRHAGRRFSGVLHLTHDWSPSAGGLLRFRGEDGVAGEYAPVFNEFILFDVARHNLHEVTSCHPAAGGTRFTANWWFI
jgi:Rps23 Pro-64 3,4-dihydroxylase Tpa1-like proline 4-hydroxylase